VLDRFPCSGICFRAMGVVFVVALSLPQRRKGAARFCRWVPENLAHKGRQSKQTAVPGDGDAK
jgi:hypothetical protein